MTTAMILAAGLGTRLRPLTTLLPKPLLPVGDAPLLVQIERWLARQGVTDVVVNTHHAADRFAGLATPLPTRFVHEPAILGTAGGIAHARPWLGDGATLVWNGDIRAAIDARALLAACQDGAAYAAWAVARRAAGEGTVGISSSGLIVRVRGFRGGVEAAGGDFLGVHALSARLQAALPPTGDFIDAIGPALERGEPVRAIAHGAGWDDIGSFDAYLAANLRWLAECGAGSWAAETARVSEGSRLVRTIVGEGAAVTGEGVLEEVVVWPGAKARAPLRRAVVTTEGVVTSPGG